MHTKLFEVRDEMTFIAVLTVQMDLDEPESNAYLLRRAGYGSGKLCVLLTRLNGGKAFYDPYDWDNRTMQVAHKHIEENFSKLETGAVIDVQFILGETTEPKKSERFLDLFATER